MMPAHYAEPAVRENLSELRAKVVIQRRILESTKDFRVARDLNFTAEKLPRKRDSSPIHFLLSGKRRSHGVIIDVGPICKGNETEILAAVDAEVEKFALVSRQVVR
jgi:hypothetical protein